MPDRKTVLGLLDRMKLEYTPKISPERAERKVVRNLKKKGFPQGMTESEIDLVKELGFDIPEKTKPEPEKPSNIIQAPIEIKDESPKEKPKPKKKSKSKKISWFEAAARAIMNKECKGQKSVEFRAKELYLQHGGSDRPNIDSYAKANVSQIARVLRIAGVPESEKINIR